MDLGGTLPSFKYWAMVDGSLMNAMVRFGGERLEGVEPRHRRNGQTSEAGLQSMTCTNLI